QDYPLAISIFRLKLAADKRLHYQVLQPSIESAPRSSRPFLHTFAEKKRSSAVNFLHFAA
ncbi:MAG: hypothetical protein K0U72_02390, partial [Gammaproteobacteria bacterium]|nr:hypothetical protein [Gammaproteobacteria bacterium]